MESVHRRQVLAGLVVAAQGAAAGVAFGEARRYAALQAVIDGYVAQKKLPGLVIAVARGRETPQFLSGGTLAFDTTRPAGPDSLFRVFSMSKPITGIATMLLIEAGKLRLDQPLHEILPGFKDPKVIVDGDVSKTRPANGPILIRHLLTHTSGLGYGLFGERPLGKLYRKQGIRPGEPGAPAEPGGLPVARTLDELGERLAPLPLDFDPGTRWQYSVAADLLGLVIQRVSGQTFPDFLRSRLFEPLGMRDTSFVVPKAKLERLTSVVFKPKEGPLATADDRKSSTFAHEGVLPSGGGGLVSTAADYIRFNQMLLNEGLLGGRQILKPETVRLARSNLILDEKVRAAITGVPTGFGALMQVILPGRPGIGGEAPGSFGWSGAAGTTMWVDPANDVTVAVMVQFFPASAYPIYLEARTATYKDLKAT